MPYSVSPLRTLNSVGGKDSEKRSTRIPTALATVKCPSSCSTISSTIPRRVRTQLIAPVWQALRADPGGEAPQGRFSRAPRDGPRCLLARAAIGLVERLEGEHGLAAQAGERALDHLGDVQEAQPPLEEGVHGDLVCRVEHARRGPPLARGLARAARARRRQGNASRSTGSKLSSPTAARSSGAIGSATLWAPCSA